MPSPARVLDALARRGLTLAVVESFTGGRLLDALTDVPGASRVVLGGLVAYSNDAKRALLKVRLQDLQKFGAASPQVAEAMARGVRRTFGADLGIATTGIAGPGGATTDKPVGLGIVGLASRRSTWTDVRRHRGSRAAVKSAAVRQALRLIARAQAPNR